MAFNGGGRCKVYAYRSGISGLETGTITITSCAVALFWDQQPESAALRATYVPQHSPGGCFWNYARASCGRCAKLYVGDMTPARLLLLMQMVCIGWQFVPILPVLDTAIVSFLLLLDWLEVAVN